jgi:type II secretory pathway component GspD/PulD (secretin)/Tfp pilus assembly protein PilF
MENRVSGPIVRLFLSVLVFVLTVFLIVPSVSAQQGGPAPENAAQYQSYLDSAAKLMEQGNYREAIAEFNRALLLNPDSEEARRGIIKANQQIAARQVAPSSAEIEEDRVKFHLSKGTEYYDAQKYDEAIAEWEQVLQIAPDNRLALSLIEAAKRAKVDLLIEQGHDKFFDGYYDEAIAIWEQAAKIVPASTVLEDLIAEANKARNEREKDRLDAKLKVLMQGMGEYATKEALLPEGADYDGIKREDVSLRPPPRKIKEFGAREAILKELSQPVAFEFECESLREVLKFLTEITGINILVDEQIFEQFGKDVDCYGTEVDRKEIFVTIHVSELPLESALNGMLRQHGLGFSIERDFIYVSTPDVLRGSSFEQLETRFYHIRDTSRVSLPKLDTRGTTGGVSLGGQALNLASGQTLVGRVSEVRGSTLLEVDPYWEAISVPKLVNILRTFVPTVLDPTKQATTRRAAVGQDRMFGGLESSEDQARLFESPRILWADTSGREILSLIDFDPHTNILIVRNTPTNLDMVEVFLDHLDPEPRQIAVEAKFITYNMLEARKVGIDFEFGGQGEDGAAILSSQTDVEDRSTVELGFDTDIGEGITGAFLPGGRGGNIVFKFSKDDDDFLKTTINLLEELSSTQVVSAPRLVTLNNKPAVIQDVETRSFRSNFNVEQITVPVEGATPVVNVSVTQEFTDVTDGITLSITPQIQADNSIRLFILPDVARIVAVDEFDVTTSTGAVGGAGTVTNTITRPRVARQSIFSNVVLNDGDTIVIGGLIENTESYQNTGVPFFQDIPLLGRFFENETEIQNMQNLLIFITVNILDSRGVAYTRLK